VIDPRQELRCPKCRLYVCPLDSALPLSEFPFVGSPAHPFRLCRRVSPGAPAFSTELTGRSLRKIKIEWFRNRYRHTSATGTITARPARTGRAILRLPAYRPRCQFRNPFIGSRAEGGGEGRSAGGGRVVARVTHGPVTHFPAEAFVACRSVIQCRVRRARPRWCGSAGSTGAAVATRRHWRMTIIYHAAATLAAATVKIDIERIADGRGDSPNRE
jgi:hypothetical protein